MDDLISRQTAIDALILLQDHSDMPEDWHKGISVAISCIYRVPSVERKKGKWERITGMVPPEYQGHYCCSECWWHFKGYVGVIENSFNFCPNCGAEMVGET